MKHVVRCVLLLQLIRAACTLQLVTDVRERLGLRLDSKRGAVPVLVIDSVQRPAAN